jgi:RHS repeat-associated protein
MTYNADRQRVKKESHDGTVTGFLYDHKTLLHETDGEGDPANTYTNTTEEYGGLISEYDDSGTPTAFYHQFDAQHASNAITDDAGSVVQKMKYSAFGLPSASSNPGWDTLTAGDWNTLTPGGWADLPANAPGQSNKTWGGQKGYYFDRDLALYLLGIGDNGRHYDAAAGRFTSEDPIRQAARDLNLFRYVKNDPVSKIDPGGKEDKSPIPLADFSSGHVEWYRPPHVLTEQDMATIGRIADLQNAQSSLEKAIQQTQTELDTLRNQDPSSPDLHNLAKSLNQMRAVYETRQNELDRLRANNPQLQPQASPVNKPRPVNRMPFLPGTALVNAVSGYQLGVRAAAFDPNNVDATYDELFAQSVSSTRESVENSGLAALAGFAKGIGETLMTTAVATVVIFGISLASVPVAITAGGALIIWGISDAVEKRLDEGQTAGEISLGALADVTGASELWAAWKDKDLATGKELYLSSFERGENAGAGTVQAAQTVLVLVEAGKLSVKAVEKLQAPATTFEGKVAPQGTRKTSTSGSSRTSMTDEEWEEFKQATNKTTLYHKGALEGGKVSTFRKFSTGTDYTNVASLDRDGTIHIFKVPNAVLNEWISTGKAITLTDTDQVTGVQNQEIRILPPASGEMNKYIQGGP